MWLINTTTLRLEDVLNPETEQYAILSHTWEAGEEVSFDEFADLDKAKRKAGYAKIAKTCEMARSQGLKYAWVDTCCIDKRSSAELAEAINSMFKWYRASQICYAYIADLPPIEGNPKASHDWLSGERSYRWFSRGWTLQELIAPKNMHFYDKKWHPRGTKTVLAKEIARTTGVDDFILDDPKHLTSVLVARRMSWASHRQTTRIEDMAYCLLGIFNINMPMIYGEGNRAFLRLQEEIAKETNDLSMFAWKRLDSGYSYSGLLAMSPSEFEHCHHLVRHRDFLDPSPEFAMTNRGIKIEAYTWPGGGVLSLQCAINKDNWRRIGILIYKTSSGFVRCRPGQLYLWDKENDYRIFERQKTTLIIPKLLDEEEYQRVSNELSGRIYIRHKVDKRYSAKPVVLAPDMLWNSQEAYFLTMEHPFSFRRLGTEFYPVFTGFQVFDVLRYRDPICRCLLICGLSRWKKTKYQSFAVAFTDQDRGSSPRSNEDSPSEMIDLATSFPDGRIPRTFLDKLWRLVERRFSIPTRDDFDWTSLEGHSAQVKRRLGKPLQIRCSVNVADENGNSLISIVVKPNPQSCSKYVVTISVEETM